VTGAGECAGIRHLLGVYLLGAIEPADRAAVGSHLPCCAECRDELAGLAALPALFARVPAAEAAGHVPDEAGWDGAFDPQAGAGLPRLLDRAARIRRVRRWQGTAAAAAAVLITAGATVAAQRVLHPAASPVQVTWKTVSARNDVTLASATVDYAPTAWGNRGGSAGWQDRCRDRLPAAGDELTRAGGGRGWLDRCPRRPGRVVPGVSIVRRLQRAPL
jgi:hypothetical protein